jgi:Holliday junction resolvase RusA-like endonuclease
MSHDLSQLFPNASADFLRKNGFANLPPVRQQRPPETPRTANLAPTPTQIPLLPDRASNASGHENPYSARWIEPIATFTLPYPPTENTYRRTVILGGKNTKQRAVPILSREARAYKDAVKKVAPALLLDGLLHVSIALYRPRKVGDIDNGLKALFDSMSGIVYLDDSQICRLEVERFDDKANPRAEVTITAR